MCIGKFCRRNVVCATRDTTIVEAADLMRHNHVGDVIVSDETDEGGALPACRLAKPRDWTASWH